MYKARVSNDIIIDKKEGKVRLSDFKINVDGYTEPKLLEKAKESYNNDKELKVFYKSTNWPKGTWYKLYSDMYRNLLKWKKRVYKKD
ncbi:MAG: hypothetical protein QXZ20_03330 [Candidatus Aenigmatarchaeota archaeon]